MTSVQNVRGVKVPRTRQNSTYGFGIGTAYRARMSSVSAAFTAYGPSMSTPAAAAHSADMLAVVGTVTGTQRPNAPGFPVGNSTTVSWFPTPTSPKKAKVPPSHCVTPAKLGANIVGRWIKLICSSGSVCRMA